MAKIIAVTNQKGGVGKTTTSVNLSEGLCKYGKKVLLIDLDPQASASCSLGFNRRLAEYSIYKIMTSDVSIRAGIVKPEFAKCDFVISNLDLSFLDVDMIDNPDKMFILSNKLEEVKDDYDYIIIDCPPSLGLITLNSLYAADSVLIPVQCQFLAIDGLTQLLNTIRIVQKSKKDNNKVLEIEGVLITMQDKRVASSWEIASEIKECFGEKVFKTVINSNVKAQIAPIHSKPVLVFAPSSPASKQYKELAKELISNNG